MVTFYKNYVKIITSIILKGFYFCVKEILWFINTYKSDETERPFHHHIILVAMMKLKHCGTFFMLIC